MDVAVSQAQRRIDLPAEQPFRVGGASMDPASREAVFKGGKERLQPQNLKVLIALARRKGATPPTKMESGSTSPLPSRLPC